MIILALFIMLAPVVTAVYAFIEWEGTDLVMGLLPLIGTFLGAFLMTRQLNDSK